MSKIINTRQFFFWNPLQICEKRHCLSNIREIAISSRFLKRLCRIFISEKSKESNFFTVIGSGFYSNSESIVESWR